MKKSVNKLALNRETLRSMEDRRLVRVAGGVPSNLVHQFQPTGCDCETDNCYPETACFGSCSCSLP
jgi:hypothetical protein